MIEWTILIILILVLYLLYKRYDGKVVCPNCGNVQWVSDNKKEICNKCSKEWFVIYEEENG